MRQVRVSGPLELDTPSDYATPIVVHFTVIQTAEDDPNGEQATRVWGFTHVDDAAAGTWDGSVEYADGGFSEGMARGIAVAVLPRATGFGYDTRTWCDTITLA